MTKRAEERTEMTDRTQGAPTPRTDALCATMPRECRILGQFARALERELAAAQERVARAEAALQAQAGIVSVPRQLIHDILSNAGIGEPAWETIYAQLLPLAAHQAAQVQRAGAATCTEGAKTATSSIAACEAQSPAHPTSPAQVEATNVRDLRRLAALEQAMGELAHAVSSTSWVMDRLRQRTDQLLKEK